MMTDFAAIGQPALLLLKHLLDRPLAWAPERKICYRELKEFTYREFYERIQRLAHQLTRLGVQPGDRVGVMDLDSHRYLELFFAVPMVGAVLHTINVRLSSEQLHYTIEHAEDKLLFVHADFVALAAPLLPRLPSVQGVVLLADQTAAPELPLPSRASTSSSCANLPRASISLTSTKTRSQLCSTPPAQPAIRRASISRTGSSCCIRWRSGWRSARIRSL